MRGQIHNHYFLKCWYGEWWTVSVKGLLIFIRNESQTQQKAQYNWDVLIEILFDTFYSYIYIHVIYPLFIPLWAYAS